MFATLGAVAAGQALLADAVAQERNPAAQVEDRSSTIKITKARATRVGPTVFVKIETNHGVMGWGEIKGVDPKVSKPLAESLFDLIDGENPTRIEHLWQKLYRAHRDIRGGPFMIHTIAGIDIALWDLAGKLWNTSVYRLLGGPTRNRIRDYHTAQAKKIPPGGPYEHSGTPADIERIVASIKATREQVGPGAAARRSAGSWSPGSAWRSAPRAHRPSRPPPLPATAPTSRLAGPAASLAPGNGPPVPPGPGRVERI
jgi:hypothetical protein